MYNTPWSSMGSDERYPYGYISYHIMLNIGLRASAGMCDSVPSSLGSRGIIDDWSIDGEQTRVPSPCVHHVFGALAQLGVGGSLSRPRGDDVIRDDLMFRRAFQNTIQGSILVFQPPLPWMSSLGGSWNVCPSNPNPTRLLDTHPVTLLPL